LLLLSLTLGFLPGAGAAEAPAGEQAAAPPGRVKRNADGDVILTLDAATRKVMGLQTAVLAPTRVNPELKAYGRVLDATPLASLVAESVTAQAARDTSEAELKRLQTLAAQGNASQRALETAEAAVVRDRALVASVRQRLVASWGSAIAERKDLAEWVNSIVSLAAVVVELDVPPGPAVSTAPNAARVIPVGQEAKPIEVQVLGPAPLVDPQTQGRGFILLMNPNTASLAPGAAVAGYLTLPGEPESGALLPRDAIVRFNGSDWVYQQKAEDTFQRVAVVLDRPLAEGWFLRAGLKPQDKVVVTGAQEMLSEELKSQLEE